MGIGEPLQTMTSYEASIRDIHALSAHERQSMASLYLSHYDSAGERQFQQDLESKTQALLVYWKSRLVGFTTLHVYDRKWSGHTIRVVYSGDTVMHREHWGQQALAFTWIAHMGELKRAVPEMPLYWFLIVKGHRTFRYLPAFSKSFFPHWSASREDLKPLADQLAREKFGNDYNPRTGVVDFAMSRGQLKPDIPYPKGGELRHEAVRYFLHRNPNYLMGHELVCVCELREDNLKPLARRIFSRGSACNLRGCA